MKRVHSWLLQSLQLLKTRKQTILQLYELKHRTAEHFESEFDAIRSSSEYFRFVGKKKYLTPATAIVTY